MGLVISNAVSSETAENSSSIIASHQPTHFNQEDQAKTRDREPSVQIRERKVEKREGKPQRGTPTHEITIKIEEFHVKGEHGFGIMEKTKKEIGMKRFDERNIDQSNNMEEQGVSNLRFFPLNLQ